MAVGFGGHYLWGNCHKFNDTNAGVIRIHIDWWAALHLWKETMNMAVIHVDDQSFEGVIANGGTVLVDFWAEWCGPCKRLSPILDELNAKEASAGRPITIAKLNVDENPETVAKYGVMSMPTMILFHNGQPVNKIVGLRPLDALEEFVKQSISA
jgi:thioredoxin 1